MSAAGALGAGGAFAYLKPIDVVNDGVLFYKKKPEVEASSDHWELILDLTGAHLVRNLVLSSNNYLESTIRIEWDGKTEDYKERQGGSNSSESIVVVGDTTSSYYSKRFYTELIVKERLKVWLNVSKCNGDDHTNRNVSISYNYSPVVVETLG